MGKMQQGPGFSGGAVMRSRPAYRKVSRGGVSSCCLGKVPRTLQIEGKEEEEEFFNHYKNDLKRHAHTPSGVAGADLKS